MCLSKTRVMLSAVLGIAVCAANPARAAQSIILPGATDNGRFGYKIAVLANGNFVVSEPEYDIEGAQNVGAVTLHRPDGSVISRLHGSHAGEKIGLFGVTPLPSGNFVVFSTHWHEDRGAVTWVDGLRGLDGEISEHNSLVGVAPGDYVGSGGAVLANGHYVVASFGWNNHLGATTWCDGLRGCRGTPTTENSLHGSNPGDSVGDQVVPLPNGNYVVVSWNWNHAAGAVTFADGNRGLTGAVSAANSLVGTQPWDRLGWVAGVTVLANGDYVVSNWNWGPSEQERYFGAVTFASGTQGVVGQMSAANSLVGTQPLEGLETFVTPLDDGGYLVHGRRWNEERGALVRCAAGAPCRGEWSSQAVLLGRNRGDFADSYAAQALPNGNAVLSTPGWDGEGAADAGAATLIDSTLARDTLLDGSRSLVGSHAGDRVGEIVTPLASGDYVVGSPQWSSDLVASAGAATWRDGMRAQGDTVSVANSFTGGSTGDFVGDEVQPLASGGYVVRSGRWSDVVNGRRHVGALTFCAADAPCGAGGPASPDRGNSLVGKVGADLAGAGVTALDGDDFLIIASGVDRDGLSNTGALLWWRGATAGAIDRSNAFFGTYASDLLGNGEQFTRHADGSFRLYARTYGQDDRGAVIYGREGVPLLGEVDADNAVLGGAPGNPRLLLTSGYDAERRQMIVGDPAANRVVLFRPGAATQVALTVIATDPDAPQPSVRVRIAVTTQDGVADGPTRVQADGGEVCEGVSIGGTQEPDGHVAWSECTLEFENGGEKVLRAEHLGTDSFGYASSAPLSVTLASWNTFRNGFE